MAAPSVIFYFTKSTTGDCYIQFLLNGDELARFTYHLVDSTVSITERPQGDLPEATFLSFLAETHNFIANIRTRYAPSELLSTESKFRLDVDFTPRRIVLNNMQNGLHYRVEYSDHNFKLFPRNAHTFAWGDFVEFVKQHQVLVSYISA